MIRVIELIALYEERKVYMEVILGKNIISAATADIEDFEIHPDDPHFPYLVEFRHTGALSIFLL